MPTRVRTRASSYGASSCCQNHRAVAQLRERGGDVIGRERDRAGGCRRRGVEKRGVDLRRELRQFLGGRSGRRDVAGGEQDLDRGAKHVRARPAVARFLERSPDHGARGLGLALIEPEQREPRVQPCAGLAREAIAFFGQVELAAKPVQLGELGAGRAQVGRRRLARQPLAGAPRFVDRARPVPAELHHLGPAHETASAKRRHVRMRRAPSRQRRRPFLRAPPVEQLVARADHAAVDDPGDEGRDLAARHAEHHLVEEREPFGLPLQAQQRAADAVARERRHVRVAELGADRCGFAEERVRALDVAFDRLLEAGRAEQEPAFGARASRLVEQPAGPREPAAGLALLAGPVEQGERQEERAAGRGNRVALFDVTIVGTGAGVGGFGVAADEVSGGREAVEVLGRERRLAVGGDEPFERVGPRLAVERGASVGKRRSHRGHDPADRCRPPARTGARGRVSRRGLASAVRLENRSPDLPRGCRGRSARSSTAAFGSCDDARLPRGLADPRCRRRVRRRRVRDGRRCD